ncbi:MAG TPA: cytochrome c maturation protein CcmE [Candidatus Limnocylindria bacterium]|nr:cytochrome c maturation protein CcmE [Candidatus Limnocylindria bacterium]
MSLARPVPPPYPSRGPRWGILAGVLAVVVVIAYFALSGIGNALVYYLTPTELLARGDAAVGETVRLGGLVKIGSIVEDGQELTFVVTDGTNEIRVHSSRLPTQSFREGIGAVVEGELAADGHFEATQVIVKHDENYVAPSEGALPSQVIDPGT